MEELIEKLDKIRYFHFKLVERATDFKYTVRMSCNKTQHLIAEIFSKLNSDEFILNKVYSEDYNNVFMLSFNDEEFLKKLYDILFNNSIYNILLETSESLEYVYIYDKEKVHIGDKIIVKRVLTDGIKIIVCGEIIQVYDNYCLVKTDKGYNTTISIQ